MPVRLSRVSGRWFGVSGTRKMVKGRRHPGRWLGVGGTPEDVEIQRHAWKTVGSSGAPEDGADPATFPEDGKSPLAPAPDPAAAVRSPHAAKPL